MIKFFRKIRQNLLVENKNAKYFKYAIGEIILVVIGILIALQINNWNENRVNQKKIKNYVVNLIQDLKNDTVQTHRRIRGIKHQINYIDSTANYFRKKKIRAITNIDAIYELNFNYGYKPLTWFDATIEEIKNSGSLNLIKNDSLREKIISYYSFTNHLNQDYLQDSNLASTLDNLQAKIININYPNIKAFKDSIGSYYRKPKSAWLQSYTYKKAKDLDLKLLTTDINDFHILVNNLLSYKGQLKIRSNGEFPKLIKEAKEIIEMIEKEYLVKE